jgi:hypothetical protein
MIQAMAARMTVPNNIRAVVGSSITSVVYTIRIGYTMAQALQALGSFYRMAVLGWNG